METKEMNKEQYIAYIEEKYSLPKEEVLEMWNEFELDAKAFNVNEEFMLNYIKGRYTQSFAKLKMQRGAKPEDYKVIIVGITSTDYGAKNKYDKAMEAVISGDEILIEANIAEGLLNENHQPIFPPDTKLESKRGKVINLEDENQTQISVISKKTNGEDKFKKGVITIKTKDIKKLPTLFSINTVKLVPGKKSDEEHDVLYGNKTTVFKEEKILSEEKVEDLFKNFYKDIMFDMAKISDIAQDYPDRDADNWSKYVLVKANVVDINITGEGKNNNISIISATNEEGLANVWVSEQIPINFDYRAQNIWVYGTVSWKEDNQMATINAISLYVPEQFRITEKAKEIKIEKAVKEEQPEKAPEIKAEDVEF